jgi:predicted DNA repair protein MutK
LAGGLFALLDDISVLAKAAASGIDDVATGAAKTAVKTSGVIVDDVAAAPQYVTGLSPTRELPVVWKITKGSLPEPPNCSTEGC